MGLQIKDFVSVVASMTNYAKSTQDKLTDFQVGSVARTMMEAPAIEIDELYQRIFWGLLDAIPTSVYMTFGYDKKPAQTAQGYVVVTALEPLASDVQIKPGAVFEADDGRRYLAQEALLWRAGQSELRVLVHAQEAGAKGNIGSGKIVSTEAFPDFPVLVNNELIATGKDEEGEEERVARFADYIKSISRGTATSIRYAVKQVQVGSEYVTRANVQSGGGFVRVYIHSSRGRPSAQLLDQAQRVIDGYDDSETGQDFEGFVAAGVRADVLPMTERVIAMAAQVQMLASFELSDAVRNQLRDVYATYVRSVNSGGLLLIDELRDLLLSVPGVMRVVLATDTNEPCAPTEILVPGVLSVSALPQGGGQ